MLWGGHIGRIELRNASQRLILAGNFPYNSRAVLSDGGRRGRPRKEQFAPGAFAYSAREAMAGNARVDFLVGHSFDRPLASTAAETLMLEDTEEALLFEAILTPEIQETSYARDFLAGLASGLVLGVSPGFRIPPKQTVPDAEEVTEEDPEEGRAIIRTIFEAILFELSAVTRPAYPEAQIEARQWTPVQMDTDLRRALMRWRA